MFSVIFANELHSTIRSEAICAQRARALCPPVQACLAPELDRLIMTHDENTACQFGWRLGMIELDMPVIKTCIEICMHCSRARAPTHAPTNRSQMQNQNSTMKCLMLIAVLCCALSVDAVLQMVSEQVTACNTFTSHTRVHRARCNGNHCWPCSRRRTPTSAR